MGDKSHKIMIEAIKNLEEKYLYVSGKVKKETILYILDQLKDRTDENALELKRHFGMVK